MQKKYTIRDIAELAGVSKGTVDRVIHKRGKVSQKALEKVTKLLDDINYQPNLIARNLKNNKTFRICVLMPDPTKDPYWTPCIDGINDVINELHAFRIDIDMFFFDPKSTVSFLDTNKKILNTHPNAVLIVPLFLKESLIVLENYNALNIITSIFNNHINSTLSKNFVGQDLHQSGRVAAKLLSTVLRKEGDIAIIHIDEKYKNAVYVQEKEKGFRNYFDESTSFKNDIVTLKLKHPDFEKSLAHFLEVHQNLIGIFVTTSKAYQIAPLIERISHQKIAIVGYDLLHENVSYLKNGVIDFLIHQNPKRQAYLGLKLLAEHLLFDKTIPEEILLPIDIVNSENVVPFMRS